MNRQGIIYVVDSNNNRIEKFSSVGKPLSAWGKAGGGPGQFNNPGSVAVDGHGNVYVADTGNNRIQKFSADGVLLAEQGAAGLRPGEFVAPTNVAVDSHGNVYVLDAMGVHKLAPRR